MRFAAASQSASRIWVSLFDKDGDRETERLEMQPAGDGVHTLFVPGLAAGARYGLRADGDYDPDKGNGSTPTSSWSIPMPSRSTGPMPTTRAWRHAAARAAIRRRSCPRPSSRNCRRHLPPRPPLFTAGGLIYEAHVRALTIRHPDIPEPLRGTVAALAHPAIVEHLAKLGVSAVELMPVVAWIDERHLGPLGLTNAWGYNPVTFKVLDPRLAPGGIVELRDTVTALREAGIGVVLDLVFNHTGESDRFGPTLSLRGLDAGGYYQHEPNNRGPAHQ